MPIHDWTRVRSNRFHHFHQDWTIEIARALNRGVLPDGFAAMAEQITGGPEPDVVALELPIQPGVGNSGGLAVATAPPKVTVRAEAEAFIYARKANAVMIRHPDGNLVAVIEIVSPGNKDSQHAIRSVVWKAVEFLRAGVHLLIVDLFPPSKHDPQGIHKLIWERIQDEKFILPADKPLMLAAYAAGRPVVAYIEPVGGGGTLTDMPLFLTAGRYVPCPLEATYQASWDAYPKSLKAALESPVA